MKGTSFVEYVAVDMRRTTKALGKINVHSVIYNVGDEKRPSSSVRLWRSP